MSFISARKLGAVMLPLVIASTAIAAGTASARATHSGASLQACALLPDTKSSTRYTLFDAPYLTAAFKKAGISAQVLNAQGDSARQKSQAEGCLAKGAKVILLDPFTTAAGTAITAEAVSQGAKVIDYDRLVPGSKVSYYVSFDNVLVGKMQAQGLIGGLKAAGTYAKKPVIAELNGGITDNNGHLFKQGYDSVLSPLYKSGVLKKATAGDQWTDWDPVKGRTIFDQMEARNSNGIQGVLAANDGLAGAVIASLQAHGLKPIPLTGQDATPTGVQYILAGWQTGTVYKSVRLEANAAATLAVALVKGTTPKTTAKVSGTPSVLLTPIWLTKHNYKKVFTDGFLKKSDVCTGKYAQFCK
jgi:D-xylose transport system substrate-binding protein